MEIEVARLRIAKDVHAAETALNEAMLAQSSLFAQLLAARKETGANPFLGHEQLLRLAKAQQALLSSSGDLCRLHGGLLKIQEEVAGPRECPEEFAPMGFVEAKVA